MKTVVHAIPGMEGKGFAGMEKEIELGEEGIAELCTMLSISPHAFLPLKWEKDIEILAGEEFVRIKRIETRSAGKAGETNRRLRELLRRAGARFREFSHPEARTSEEAAKIRGTRLEQGVKCLVVEASGLEGRYAAILLPASRKLERGKLRKRLGNISLVSPEKAEELTGCRVGGIPPLGHGLPTFASREIFGEEELAFNAGFRTHSIICDAKGFGRALELASAEMF